MDDNRAGRVSIKDGQSLNAKYQVKRRALPSKHKTFVYHLYNVGPTSKTLGRHCTNVTNVFLCLLGIHVYDVQIEEVTTQR